MRSLGSTGFPLPLSRGRSWTSPPFSRRARWKLERRFLAVLDGADLPRPRLNADLAVRGRFFEADCLWAEQRLIVELDGRESHRTDLAFEKDRERDRILLVEGWRVARVTRRQLRDDSASVVADLRGLLREEQRPPTL